MPLLHHPHFNPLALAALLVLLAVLLCAAPARAQVPEHCKNGTLSYDISFIGPLKQLKVGESTKIGVMRM